MHKTCTKFAQNMQLRNMQYICIVHNKPKICINMQIYADVWVICLRVNMPLYAN